MNEKIKKITFVTLIIIISYIIIHSIIIIFIGINDNIDYVDAAVVFGNKVNKNGIPSNRLKSRLDTAIEYYNQKYYKKIIISGGIGKEGYDEAEIMKQYLIKHNIPETSIIKDNSGNNTFLTVKNSIKIMNKENFNSLMVISQYYHISRIKLTYKRFNIKNVKNVHAKYIELRDLYSIIREIPGYYSYLLKKYPSNK